MRHLLASLWALIAISVCAEAHAGKRVALVIGNAVYQHTAELNSPGNDAADVTAMLQRLGFEVVDGRDLDKRSMERLIRQFVAKLTGADVAMFFYAGHGLQIGGQNYLVPTDARLASEGDVDFESLPVNLVIKQMEREAKTSLVLLDACRDNPLARSLARTMSTRSSQVGQGLAEASTGVGTLIAYSTQPGYVSLDTPGRNSPYTQALLRHAEAPGNDLSGVLVEVRNDVLKATNGRQVPWEHTSLTGQVYLKAAPVSASFAAPPPISAPAAASAPVSTGNDKELELAFWNSVKDSKSPAMFGAYLDRYPNGTFAGLARVMQTQLKDASPRPQEPTKTASFTAPDIKPQPAPDAQGLARSLQSELKRVGCDPGSIDGVWGARGREALGDFARYAKTSVPTDEPTAAALDAVSSQKGRVCPLECDDGEVAVKGKCVAKASKARKAQRPEPRERAESSSRSRPSSEEQSSSGLPLGGSIFLGIGRKGGGIGIGF